MAWVVILNSYHESINDMIRNPKGVALESTIKIAIVDSDLESRSLGD